VDKLCQLLLSSCPLERTSLGKLRPRLSGTEADLLVRQLGDEVKFPGGSVQEAWLEPGFKKNQPSGFFRFFWVFLGFFGFLGFLDFFLIFAQKREFLGFFQFQLFKNTF
jgi:hypothetical protein